ncbi:hypothetical protein [Amycolatopsis sp.]|nr:hypothetical protein [Amycolatopsis sp.]
MALNANAWNFRGAGVVGSVQSSKDRGEWVLVAELRAGHFARVVLVMAM